MSRHLTSTVAVAVAVAVGAALAAGLAACAGSPAPAARTAPATSAGTGAAPAGAAPAVTATPDPGDAARAPLTLTYLGVAGWSISDGARTVLVDPYFSRPPRDAPPSTPLVPDAAAIAARAPARADLILVGHSHFDHALDVAEVARRTGAQVIGTISTTRLAAAAGLPADRLVPVAGGEDYAFDGVSVRVIPSLHSALDDKHFSQRTSEVPADVALPLPAAGYVEGGTLAYLVRLGGHQVLVLGTANFIERELDGLRPDVAIVATGLREEITDYTCRLMGAVGAPPLVLANHFDDWRSPPRGSLAGLSDGARASVLGFADEVHACAPATRVIVPEQFEPITWP